jgi:hypothetical protein
VRLKFIPSSKDSQIEVEVELFPEGQTPDQEAWNLGCLKFTLDEWTLFVREAAVEGTSLGFDILSEDGEGVLL